MPSNIESSVKYANKEVVLTSASNVYTFNTDASGVLQIAEIIPDEYTINTSWEMTGAQYKQLISANEMLEDKAKVLLKATIANYPLFDTKNLSVDLEKIIMKSLLISKVYYSGTKDNRNRNYTADSFVEIFNNSDETVYLDGKYLALAESMTPAAYLASDDPDYIYTRQICKFPGGGTDYPLGPGESIVIAARNARDHTTSASNSVDLSTADFEVKELDGTGNPDVKALPVISSSVPLKFLNLISGGPNALFLFETDEDIFTWQEVFAPGKTSGERFRKVPVSTVIDGVEALKNSASTGPDINLKRFQDIVDAGYVFINGISGYTNESVERKISEIDNGRIILQDSNNSLDDFEIISGPEPRNYDNQQLLNQ
ncbi:MAG: DUF4876 domain-containing protein [Bacteroidales bacterium]|nr:DUF4876 domain-containing protein [Bacteroidales bacterium]